MNARNMLNGMIGGNHPPEVWRLALDAYRDQVRAGVLEEVEEDLNLLRALQAAGVDNWSSYDDAMEILHGLD